MKTVCKSKKSVILVAILLVVTLCLVFFFVKNSMCKADGEKNTSPKYAAERIEDGTVLQTFCWSFNSIRKSIPEIKKAGYTAIQTSPIAECLTGNSNDMKNWYYLYQPTGYKIGNKQLGTEEEFKAMCKTANANGIKVIVDVIPNHFTSDFNSISPEYRNFDYVRQDRGNMSYSSRYDITQLALLGLWDVKTQDKNVQNNISAYLQRILDDGASGFRYDTAKHIELPEDNASFRSDFWPTILNNKSEFQYGEVLHDAYSMDETYAKYMKITASQYGYTLRSAIANNYFHRNNIMKCHTNINNSKLITWVESHDTYSNDERDSTWLTNEQIKLAWAVIAARKESTPLFFSRPNGGGGTSYDNRFPNGTRIGNVGDNLYKNDEIAAVNIFRNEMEGQNEYLRNPNEDAHLLMIERGKKGVVIINLKYHDVDLDTETGINQGSYINQTNNNNVFHVKNGKISGKLPARSVVVLYNKSDDPTPSPTPTPSSTPTPHPDNNQVTINYYTSWSAPNIHYKVGNGNWTNVPGIKMNKSDKQGYYTITIALGKATEMTACFNDGNGNWDNNNSRDYKFKPGTYTLKNGKIY